MPTQRISSEEVCRLYEKNVTEHAIAVKAMVAAGLSEGPFPLTPDPEKPWAVQYREPKEGQGPEAGWCLNRERFRSPVTASLLARDIQKLDSRLEVRVQWCGPFSTG